MLEKQTLKLPRSYLTLFLFMISGGHLTDTGPTLKLLVEKRRNPDDIGPISGRYICIDDFVCFDK